MHTRKTVGSPSAHSVYLRALSLLPVILKVTKYCALWVKVHIAWLLFDGVVSLCVHLSGIRWVRICVSFGLFLCAASCYATHVVVCGGVEWGGVGLITSNCTCIHTLCYATGRYLAVVQMKDVATLKMLLLWRCWRCCCVEDVEDVATLKMLKMLLRWRCCTISQGPHERGAKTWHLAIVSNQKNKTGYTRHEQKKEERVRWQDDLACFQLEFWRSADGEPTVLRVYIYIHIMYIYILYI